MEAGRVQRQKDMGGLEWAWSLSLEGVGLRYVERAGFLSVEGVELQSVEGAELQSVEGAGCLSQVGSWVSHQTEEE